MYGLSVTKMSLLWKNSDLILDSTLWLKPTNITNSPFSSPTPLITTDIGHSATKNLGVEPVKSENSNLPLPLIKLKLSLKKICKLI